MSSSLNQEYIGIWEGKIDQIYHFNSDNGDTIDYETKIYLRVISDTRAEVIYKFEDSAGFFYDYDYSLFFNFIRPGTHTNYRFTQFNMSFKYEDKPGGSVDTLSANLFLSILSSPNLYHRAASVKFTKIASSEKAQEIFSSLLTPDVERLSRKAEFDRYRFSFQTRQADADNFRISDLVLFNHPYINFSFFSVASARDLHGNRIYSMNSAIAAGTALLYNSIAAIMVNAPNNFFTQMGAGILFIAAIPGTMALGIGNIGIDYPLYSSDNELSLTLKIHTDYYMDGLEKGYTIHQYRLGLRYLLQQHAGIEIFAGHTTWSNDAPIIQRKQAFGLSLFLSI